MPVQREELERPRAYLRAEVVKAKRHENGRWGLAILITGTVELTDGRRVEIDREIQLSERQERRRAKARA